MRGTQLLCAAVVTHRDIGPGQTKTATFDLQASLAGPDGGEEPAPSGTYRFEACLDWTVEGKEVDTTLEGEVEVVPGN